MVGIKRFLQKVYLGLVILFLYAPILVLVVLWVSICVTLLVELVVE